jgi:hypothetical protein
MMLTTSILTPSCLALARMLSPSAVKPVGSTGSVKEMVRSSLFQ